MNRPNPVRTKRSLTAYILESIKDMNVKLQLNLHSSLQFMILKFGIDIFDSFEIKLFSAT